MRRRLRSMAWCLVLPIAAALPAQGAGERVDAVVAGTVELAELRYTRAPNGMLLRASIHEPDAVPMLGEDLGFGLSSAGLLGWLALLGQGGGDLLAMTAADLHFRWAGVAATDADLRRLLAQPLPEDGDPGARAALLDRMLAVDVLRRRRCAAAVDELAALARADVPPPLRERARRTLALLRGEAEPAITLQRLDAGAVTLPATFDAAIVIDHTRLLDMSRVTAIARQIGMLVTADVTRDDASPRRQAAVAVGQAMADAPCELPFELARRYGNGRIDHSLVIISIRPGAPADTPFALAWHAAGEFEHAGWQDAPRAAFGEGFVDDGSFEIGPRTLRVATGGAGRGIVRLTAARDLLADTGAAVRVVVPRTSKLWAMFAAAELPPATGAELRITFGDPLVMTLTVTTRDEDSANAWVAALERLHEQIAASMRTRLAPAIAADPSLADRLGTETWRVVADGNVVTATGEARGLTAAALDAIAEIAARSGH